MGSSRAKSPALRVAILLPDLRGGGAERVSIHLANAFVSRGIAVDMLLMRHEGVLLPKLDPHVRVVNLAAPTIRRSLLPLARYLRMNMPDALLAAMWPLTVLAPLASKLAGFRGSIVTSEHGMLSIGYAGYGRLHGCVLRRSLRWARHNSDASVAVSNGVADDLACLTQLPRDRFSVIYNPVVHDKVPSATSGPDALAGINGKLVLAAGSLKRVKRFDLLIEAFARIMERCEATLCIIGEGTERESLSSLIERLGIADRVLLPGFVLDPAPWFARADLFVLSSDSEGLPTVLIEAMDFGIPVVSTDCPSGPAEILDNGRYGSLVPPGDPEALAEAILDSLRRTHDTKALKSRAQDFNVDKAADAYLDLLLPDWRKYLFARASAL